MAIPPIGRSSDDRAEGKRQRGACGYLERYRDDCRAPRGRPHFAFYSQTGIFFALLERQAIDPERVFVFNRMNETILRQMSAATNGGKVAAQGATMAADMLAEFEAVIRNMCTIPPGAGRACVGPV